MRRSFIPTWFVSTQWSFYKSWYGKYSIPIMIIPTEERQDTTTVLIKPLRAYKNSLVAIKCVVKGGPIFRIDTLLLSALVRKKKIVEKRRKRRRQVDSISCWFERTCQRYLERRWGNSSMLLVDVRRWYRTRSVWLMLRRGRNFMSVELAWLY